MRRQERPGTDSLLNASAVIAILSVLVWQFWYDLSCNTTISDSICFLIVFLSSFFGFLDKLFIVLVVFVTPIDNNVDKIVLIINPDNIMPCQVLD